MKWLIVLLLFAALLLIIALRYRNAIGVIWGFLRAFRQLKKDISAQKRADPMPIETDKNLPLVRCTGCGKWISESEAMNLRSKNFYCSQTCVEQAIHA